MSVNTLNSEAANKITGFVHSVETFGSVDGPGIRFIVFMQGCRMRCEFCHNPDTWNTGGGTEMTAEEVLDQAMQYQAFWGKEGGITVSGGEALLQIDFVIDLFQKAKELGVNTCLDTCGQPFTRKAPFFDRFKTLMEVTDLLLVDIKQINSDKHKKLTGWGNENIIDMCEYLSETGKPVWIRHVLIPERTDYDDDLIKLSHYIETLKNVDKVEILPYHTMGLIKWQDLGIKNTLEEEGIEPPIQSRINNANEILHTETYIKYKKH